MSPHIFLSLCLAFHGISIANGARQSHRYEEPSLLRYQESLNKIQTLFRLGGGGGGPSESLLIPSALTPIINVTKSCPAQLLTRSADGDDDDESAGKRTDTGDQPNRVADIVDDIRDKLVNVSDACLVPAIQVIVDYNCVPRERYAVEMYDAMGKLESFVLRGNTRFFGAFHECREVQNVAVTISPEFEPSSFNAQYCVATTVYPRSSGTGIPIQLGVCVPDTCTKEEVISVVKLGLENRPLSILYGNLDVLDVYCDYDEPLSVGALSVIAVTGVVGLLVVIATLIDVHRRYSKGASDDDTVKLASCTPLAEGHSETDADREDVDAQKVESETLQSDPKVDPESEALDKVYEEVDPVEEAQIEAETASVSDKNYQSPESLEKVTPPLLTSFSMITSSEYLLSTGLDNGSKTLTSIYGMRFLSMMWIMYGMNYEMTLTAVLNPVDLGGSSIISQPVGDPGLATDTYLLISGLLVTYWTLLELKKCDTVNWLAFAVHKLIRLSPSYYFALFFFMYVSVYISKGPMQFMLESAIEPCYDYWWTNLLYIQNLYPYLDPLRQRCMGWSWCVCLLAQYYVITPFIALALHWKKSVGFFLIGLFFIVDFVSTGLLSWYYGLPAVGGLPYYNENASDSPFADYIYTKPHTRLSSYLVGICLGYILLHHNTKRRINKFLQAVCWILSIVSGFTMVYCKYWAGKEPAWTQAMTVAFLTFNRFLFSLAVGWCLFACATGRAGPVNRFLSWKFFFPLGRLTYVVYLIHPIIMAKFAAGGERQIFVSDLNFMYLYVAQLFFSYFVAFFVSLLFERPYLQLEKAIYKRYFRT